MKKLISITILIIVTMVTVALAQQGFNYQAVIRNTEGQPISEQLVGIRITLQGEGGTPIYYSETHTETTSPQGVVSLTVGEGSVESGVFADIPWEDGNIFIKIEVDPLGGMAYEVLGQAELQAVPYALFALSGNEGPQGPAGPQGLQGIQGEPGTKGDDGNEGLSAYQIWLNNGNEGEEEDFLDSLVGLQGEPGDDGVGIVSTIDNGDGTFTLVYSDESEFTTINLTGPPGLDGKTVLSGTTDPTVGIGVNGDFYINTSSSTIFGPKASGSWGSGTSLVGPQGEAGTGLTNMGNWSGTVTYNSGYYVFAESSTSEEVNSMYICQTNGHQSTTPPKDDGVNWVEFQAPQGPEGPQGPPGPLVDGNVNQTLVHNGASWVASNNIFNTGTYVGIGTTSPNQTLDINGQIRIRGGGIGAGKILTSDASGVASWQTAPDGSKWTLSGSNIYRTTGNVGIGTTSPARVFEVVSAGTAGADNLLMQIRTSQTTNNTQTTLRLINSTNGTASIGSDISSIRTNSPTGGSSDLLFRTSLGSAISERMRISSSGNVGIGITSPSEKLDVAGNIKAYGLSLTKTGSPSEDPLFVVRNTAGLVVFAVYEQGVRIYVDGDPTVDTKGNKGGFAIGGLTGLKETGEDYFRVSRDYTHILFDTGAKGNKSGFAIGGLTGLKSDDPLGTRSNGSKNDVGYMSITPENYFIGHESGSSITTGTRNTFFGYQSGVVATSAFANIFIGEKSGLNTTEGKRNIFIGYQAGRDNVGIGSHYTIGHDNIYIGGYTGMENITGEHNTFVGSQSGWKTTGTKNTFYGAFTGLQSSGMANVFVGLDAGRENTAGNNNLFVGALAGHKNNGNNNTFLGYAAGWSGSANTGTGNVFIGYYAGVNVTTSNKLYIANSSGTPLIYGDFSNGMIGLGTTTPGQRLTVAGNLRLEGANRWIYFDGGDGIFQVNGATNHLWFNVGGSYRMIIRDNGRVGIGTTSPSYQFQVETTNTVGVYSTTTGGYGVYGRSNGTGTNYGIYGSAANGSTNWAGYFSGNVYTTGTYQSSDIKLKKNIRSISNALNIITSIQGVSYEWKDDKELEELQKDILADDENDLRKFYFPEGVQLGVIAQEVEKVLPEVVITDDGGIKSVDYGKIVPVLIEAIKEQQSELEALKSELEAIKAMLIK